MHLNKQIAASSTLPKAIIAMLLGKIGENPIPPTHIGGATHPFWPQIAKTLAKFMENFYSAAIAIAANDLLHIVPPKMVKCSICSSSADCYFRSSSSVVTSCRRHKPNPKGILK